jgi:hypothetical protein
MRNRRKRTRPAGEERIVVSCAERRARENCHLQMVERELKSRMLVYYLIVRFVCEGRGDVARMPPKRLHCR